MADPAPVNAPRQPRTAPTVSTIVRASMNSTSEARKAARIVGPAFAHSISVVFRPQPRACSYLTESRG